MSQDVSYNIQYEAFKKSVKNMKRVFEKFDEIDQ